MTERELKEYIESHKESFCEEEEESPFATVRLHNWMPL